MATQVKFHNTTASAYEGATKTDGGLYFISDNGEIRKGGSHITGTRVYSATDSTGTTALAELDIKLGETSISTEGFTELPKKGDVLIVSHILFTKEGEDPKYEYSAYVYATNGGTYSANGWQACDGNVDASKVILTSDILMAGNYDKVGNLTKSTTGTATFATGGKSVAEALQEIFTKKLQPSVTQPAVTLKINNSDSNYSKSVEVGETATIPNYSATLSAGSYTYGPATGISAQSWSVKETKGNTTQTAATGTLPSIKANDGSQSYTVTATASHNAGATPKDNIGGTATVSGIAAGDKSASHTVTVSGIRYWFYGVDRVGTGTIDSAFIRGLTKGGNCETAKNDTQFTTGENAKRIVVAIPTKTSGTASIDGAKTLSNVILVSASNTPIPDQYVKQSGTVNVNDAAGENPIPYDVWIYKPASISPTEIHKLVIG